jgi:methionine-rich copper-binding protein CopC
MIVRIAPAIAGIVLLIVALVAVSSRAVFAQPSITEANPDQGDVLTTLPESLHLCFSEPVKVDDSSGWKFNVRTPDGRDLGLRIEFESNGGCVNVFPGAPEDPPEGIWTFDWLVRAQSDDTEGSGTISFQLGQLQPGETPIETPDAPADPGESDGDGDVPLALYAAAGVGGAVIMVGIAGFALSRRRRRA